MISILQLQYFQALATEQHLTRTAQQLYISQSALSTMITKLEKELGVNLFDRNGGSIRLNAYGEKYLQYVNAALLMLADGKNAVRAMGGQQDSNTLSLAISGTNAWGGIVISFLEQYPQYSVSQKSESMPELLDNLLSGQLDMALVGLEDLTDKRLDYHVLCEGRIYACLPKGHRLENRTALMLSDLAGDPVILTLRGLPYTTFCLNMFQKAGIDPHIAAECDYPMRPRLVARGMGIAFLYGPTLQQPVVADLYKDFVCIPIMDACAVRRLALFWRKGRELTTIMKDFILYFHTNRSAETAT